MKHRTSTVPLPANGGKFKAVLLAHLVIPSQLEKQSVDCSS